MSDLVCCDMCGRDTAHKSRICNKCTRGAGKHARTKMYVNDKDDCEGMAIAFGYLEYDRDGDVKGEVEDALKDCLE